jgi:hypothetical protein
VFENRVLRRMLGPKRTEMLGGWRKLHNEYLRNCLPFAKCILVRMIKSRKISWAEHVAGMEEEKNAGRILVGKPEGKRPLGRSRHRLVDIIKMVLKGIRLGGMD